MKFKAGQYIQVVGFGYIRARGDSKSLTLYRIISRRKTRNKDKVLYKLKLVSESNHNSSIIEVKSTTLNSRIQQGYWRLPPEKWLAKYLLSQGSQ